MSLPTPLLALSDSGSNELDQKMVMYNVFWSAYEAQLTLRGEAPVPRVAYLDGVMELMSSSRDHERVKSFIGRIYEVLGSPGRTFVLQQLCPSEQRDLQAMQLGALAPCPRLLGIGAN